MLHKDMITLIAVGTIMFLLLGFFIINFLFFYQKRQHNYFKEKERLKNEYQQELLSAQLEIQEHTLNHISQEIHDNIGQVLSFIKLSLSAAKSLPEEEKLEKIEESHELIAHVIGDLRDLSKSLSYENIAGKGLAEAIRFEMDRINKSAIFDIELIIEGEPFALGNQRELVLFRIFQESIHNIMSHSEAKHVKIKLQYSSKIFNLIVEDDGVGFSPDDVETKGGTGIKNMKNRAGLIGADLSISSSVNQGCITKVSINLTGKQVSLDGNYQSSPG